MNDNLQTPEPSPPQEPTTPSTIGSGPVVPEQPPIQAVSPEVAGFTSQLRSWLIKGMLACLIIAAVVAVVAVLIGEFNQITARSLSTVFSAIIHIGLVFVVLSMTATRSNNPLITKSTNLVINVSLTIAILSFFTSLLGIWQVLDWEISGKLYSTYAIVLIAILHAKTLIDVQAVYSKVAGVVYANYAAMALVITLLLGVVWMGSSLLSGFYGRLLAASAIVDVTLSIIVAVMHRLYLQKNPELTDEKNSGQSHAGSRVIVAILLFVFVVWPIVSFVMAISSFSRHY